MKKLSNTEAELKESVAYIKKRVLNFRRKNNKILLKALQTLRLNIFLLPFTEAATGGVLQEKMFLKISQNSQENTCARVLF